VIPALLCQTDQHNRKGCPPYLQHQSRYKHKDKAVKEMLPLVILLTVLDQGAAKKNQLRH
jgi:hypothetical protein